MHVDRRLCHLIRVDRRLCNSATNSHVKDKLVVNSESIALYPSRVDAIQFIYELHGEKERHRSEYTPSDLPVDLFVLKGYAFFRPYNLLYLHI